MEEGLILGPYKEPLKTVEGGFGYLGALTFDTLGKVQCHICGELFDNLAGHINNKHELSAKEYRVKYDLALGTRLISERYREEKKNNHLRYLMGLTPEQRHEHRARALKAIARLNENRAKGIYASSPQTSLEQKNKRGICPDQLLEVIRRAHDHYGHTPTLREFETLMSCRYREPIKRTFGGWNKAVIQAGLRLHTGKMGAPKGVPRVRYTDEELLDYLRVFYQENGRIPTAGDCNRGLLPSYESYRGHFGSFPEARKKAGIPDYVMNQRQATELGPITQI